MIGGRSMKQCTIILILIPLLLLFISGLVFSQENLKQHKSRQGKIVEKIMDLSNRNFIRAAFGYGIQNHMEYQNNGSYSQPQDQGIDHQPQKAPEEFATSLEKEGSQTPCLTALPGIDQHVKDSSIAKNCGE